MFPPKITMRPLLLIRASLKNEMLRVSSVILRVNFMRAYLTLLLDLDAPPYNRRLVQVFGHFTQNYNFVST